MSGVGHAEVGRRNLSASKLDPSRAALVVIDIQEAFRKAIPVFDDVAVAAGVLVEGAKAVGIPVVATEQYPKGLGRTVPRSPTTSRTRPTRSRRTFSRRPRQTGSTSAGPTRRSCAGSRPTYA